MEKIHAPRFRIVITSLVLTFVLTNARAHLGSHPSVHDTVAGIVDRMRRELSKDELRSVTVQKAEQFLTAKEREILATEHISFRVNVPVTVTILRDAKMAEQPYWLAERGFKPAGVHLREGKIEMEAWEKDFDAGWVGLGVHSLSGGGNHYLIAIKPKMSAAKMDITELYPGHLRVDKFKPGVKPYVDQDEQLSTVPAELDGQTLVRTDTESEDDARLINLFRWTEHPSSNRPDQVVLTWSDDPKTTQAIQWRTSPKIRKGAVFFQKKSAFNRFRPGSTKVVKAETLRLETVTVVNDPVIHRHTAVLRGLEPATTYVYSVGDGSNDGWSELAEFTTAPEKTRPFSFIYMGDAQNGLDRWGTLVHNAFRDRPDAAFYVMAGDLVNRGKERDDWDSLFYNAEGIFDRRQLVPVIGNHECQGGQPTLYLKQFALPTNGPATVEAKRAYAFEYSNAQFVILDSNLDPAGQAHWLEEQLSRSKAIWKFVVYHHPAYSSGGNRDNREVREIWTPIFDKYHVDLALQGHDHAYLRTYPMNGQQRVKSPKDGTVYIISVSGTKAYAQTQHDYTEVGLTNVATYQVLDIQISGNRLVYRAHDIDGKVRDEFVIEK
ncbi:MAG: metallophosphoesterase family protein [Verrucomicrobiota bacterium]